MGDRRRTGKPSRYVTSHPGQLSLAIPPWVGAVSTSESWGVNSHTAWYTSRVSVVSQCKLVSGWGLRKRKSGYLAREGLYLLTYFIITPSALSDSVQNVQKFINYVCQRRRRLYFRVCLSVCLSARLLKKFWTHFEFFGGVGLGVAMDQVSRFWITI